MQRPVWNASFKLMTGSVTVKETGHAGLSVMLFRHPPAHRFVHHVERQCLLVPHSTVCLNSKDKCLVYNAACAILRTRHNHTGNWWRSMLNLK